MSRTACLLAACTLAGTIPVAVAGGKDFTVRDSIEMVRFGDPFQRGYFDRAKLSPDGEHVLVVTSRGLMPADAIESTLSIIDVDSIRSFVNDRGGSVPGPLVKPLAVNTAVPSATFNSSYASTLTQARWAADSKSVYYLAETPAGHQLYRVAVTGGKPTPLSAPEDDVIRFSVASNTVAYLAMSENEAEARRKALVSGVPINSRAYFVGNDVPLFKILFPDSVVTRMLESLVLRTVGDGHTNTVIGENASLLQRPIAVGAGDEVLSVSPDGKFAVLVLPALRVPESWSEYSVPVAHLHIDPADKRLALPLQSLWHLRPEQYALVDLESGKVRRLIDAPQGWTLGGSDSDTVTWSANGKALLLTNTFMPLEGTSDLDHSRRLTPCAVAHVALDTMQSSCLAYSRAKDARHPMYLTDASFGASEDQIRMRFNWFSQVFNEEYRHKRGQWILASSRSDQAVGHGDVASGLEIRVRQSLNEPPTLWATDPKSGRSKQIWDPNPQLAAYSLGKAAEYQWTDKNGTRWKGGLLLPPDYRAGVRYPLVIQTHGFLDYEFMSDGIYTTANAAMPLASSGIVVLQAGTIMGVGGEKNKGQRDEAHDQVESFRAALEQLSRQGIIDPQRVGIIGFSRTCWYMLTALATQPQLFAAASGTDGVDESYVQYLLSDVGFDSEAIYGTKPVGAGLKTWLSGAPGFNMDRVTSPVLLTAIGPGSLLFEWEPYALLRAQDKPVEMAYIPDGQHILQRPLERLASQQGNVDWFRFWLQGYEDPDSAKAEQYRRWEHLCDVQRAQNPDRPASCVVTRRSPS